MSILTALEYISQYGVPLVISALVLYVAMRFINLQFDKAAMSIKNKQHDKLLQIRQEVDQQVYELINDFLSDHRGSRVQVIEFSNSVTSVAYLPFRFMSCTYEVTSYGTRPEAKTIDKLSTSLFTPFLSEMSKKGTIVLDEEKAEELSGSVHDLYERLGSPLQVCAILRSEKNKSIGYVSLCVDEPNNVDNDLRDIKILASQISALLGVVDV